MNRLVFIGFCITSVLLGPLLSVSRSQTETPAQESSPKPEAETSEDLILQQLEMLRNELRSLRSEVGKLRKEVSDIHRVAVRPQAPPAPAKVSLGDEAVLGNPDAAVGIVEFSDFQCPYCKRFHDQTFAQLKEAYIDTGKVQYIFRDFPLKQIHAKAVEASVAANCAGEQGKYWEMHDGLFDNQPRLGPELYTELAEGLALDMGAFEACLDDPVQVQEIEEDLSYGQTVGVRGTPHYFVGRVKDGELVDAKRLSGAQPYQSFQSIIDPLLKVQ